MKTLIELECRKHNLRVYVRSAVVITFIMLGMLYLFAYAPMLEPDDKDMAIFSGYQNLIPMFGVLHMAVFGVLSAVMYARVILGEYAGKRVILLLSYPVSRAKVILSKLILVAGFTAAAAAASSLVIFLIFAATESIAPLVEEPFTLAVIRLAVEMTLIMAFMAAGIGIAAAGIGFFMKSVPAAIISAVIMASVMCNIVVNTTSNPKAMLLPAAGTALAALAAALFFVGKASRMEAE